MSDKADVLIVIPARYHSSRLPGKPLAMIHGRTLLERVWQISQHVVSEQGNIDVCVATEDQRIVDYANQHDINVCLTSDQCQSGTARACETVKQLAHTADFIINLQGDNALCPPWFLGQLIAAYRRAPSEAVYTPFVKLTWQTLDKLRQDKARTPFSGTTVVYNRRNEALWFSKQIIPAIRDEEKLRQNQPLSPVARHIGLYGFHRRVLMNMPSLTTSTYGEYEGLEQLDFLENDVTINMVEVSYRDRQGMSGIDSPEDVERAEQIIQRDGELIA